MSEGNPIFCGHANEVARCPCESGCYCKTHACRRRAQVGTEHPKAKMQAMHDSVGLTMHRTDCGIECCGSCSCGVEQTNTDLELITNYLVSIKRQLGFDAHTHLGLTLDRLEHRIAESTRACLIKTVQEMDAIYAAKRTAAKTDTMLEYFMSKQEAAREIIAAIRAVELGDT